jgi:hypothetical protein
VAGLDIVDVGSGEGNIVLLRNRDLIREPLSVDRIGLSDSTRTTSRLETNRAWGPGLPGRTSPDLLNQREIRKRDQP